MKIAGNIVEHLDSQEDVEMSGIRRKIGNLDSRIHRDRGYSSGPQTTPDPGCGRRHRRKFGFAGSNAIDDLGIAGAQKQQNNKNNDNNNKAQRARRN